MTAVIVTTPDQLQAIIAEAVASGIAAATAKQRINATDLAAELGVSVPTLARMEKDGRLPPRARPLTAPPPDAPAFPPAA